MICDICEPPGQLNSVDFELKLGSIWRSQNIYFTKTNDLYTVSRQGRGRSVDVELRIGSRWMTKTIDFINGNQGFVTSVIVGRHGSR